MYVVLDVPIYCKHKLEKEKIVVFFLLQTNSYLVLEMGGWIIM